MSATIISFCSAKGGSGKTAISVSIASLLADLGKKVVLIDADQATSGLTLLLLRNVAGNKVKRSITGFYDNNTSDPIAIKNNLDFVPSSSAMENPIYSEDHNLKIIYRNAISFFAEKYDVIIFDCEAGREKSTGEAISLSNKAVIVTEFDPLSESGVQRLKFSFREKWPLGNTFILVNKMLPDFANIQGEYFTAWSHLPPVPFDFEVMRSYARAEIPWNTGALTQFIKAIAKTAMELFPEFKPLINQWFSTRTEEFKKPAKQEFDEIENELEDKMNQLAKMRASMKMDKGVRLTDSEKLIYYIGFGTGATLIIAGTLVFSYLRSNEPLALGLMFAGFGIFITVVSLVALKKSKQQFSLKVESERMYLAARELEYEIENLLQRKYQLESVLLGQQAKTL